MNTQTLPHGGAPQSGAPLPCLNINNSIEKLPNAVRKAMFVLRENVDFLIQTHGINHVGFLTLTFPDQVINGKEASKRFNSLASNYLKRKFKHWVRVYERHKNRRLHLHLLVITDCDIRTGFDFEAVRSRNYRSVPPALRAYWKDLRENLPKYSFGRHQLEPVRSSGSVMAKYLSKYLGKDMGQRSSLDKGVRLVGYSKGVRVANSRFSWASDGAREWRKKVALFVALVSSKYGVEASFDGVRSIMGSRWCHEHRGYIASLDLGEHTNAA